LLVLQRNPTESELQIRDRRRRFIYKSISQFAYWAVALQLVLCLLALLIRAVDQKEVLVSFFHFPQLEGSPPAGQGTFWQSLRYHKSTYYLAAVLAALILVGFLGSIALCVAACSSRRCIGLHQDCNCCNDPFTNYYACLGCRDCTDCCSDCCLRCRGTAPCGNMTACECGECGSWSGEGGQCLAVVAVVVAVTFLFVGAFFAMAALVTWAQKTAQGFLQLQELRQLTGEYVVQDLSELPALPPVPELLASAPVQQVLGPGEGGASGSVPPPQQHWSWAPMTDARTQQSLALDMQALYGYQSA